MPSDESLSALLADIEVAQRSLREALTGRDEVLMATRPPNGKWSVLEHVRHLLFAEQAHLGGFVPGGRDWSRLGFTPETMLAARKLPPISGGPLPTVSEVLREWSAIHRTIAAGLVDSESANARLAAWKNRRHLQAHVIIVERLLRRGSSQRSSAAN